MRKRGGRSPSPLGNALFVEPAQGIVPIRGEGDDAHEAEALVKGDRFRLINARLQSQELDSVAARMRLEVVEHEYAQSKATELGPDIHALDLPVLGSDELDPA